MGQTTRVQRTFRTGTHDSAQTLEDKTTSQAKPTLELFQLKESANGTLVLPKIPYGGPLLSVAVCRVPSRRLEDHIKDLCAKIIAGRETELEPALSELKSALHEHTVKLRRLAAEKLTGVEEPPPSGRRNEE